MTLDPFLVFLSSFAALIAWGIAVRLAPFLWHLANAFFIGFVAAIVLGLWLSLTTSRNVSRTYLRQRIVPAFALATSWPTQIALHDATLQYQALQLYPSSPDVSDAISELIELALRDFITSWYKSISSSTAFVHEVDQHVRVALVEIRDRVLHEDVIGMIVARVIPIVTNHIHEFENAERAISGRVLGNSLPQSEELDLAVAAKYRDGNLHPAASLAYSDTKSLHQEHLRKILVRILPSLLDDSMISSRAVTVLVKEIVACAVLSPIFQLLSDPDTWNQLVEAYGKATLQDRKTVKRMRAALDEHTSSVAQRQAPNEIPRLQANDSERAFEKFVRAIRKTKTLADARRFRSQITSQLARERQVDGQDPIYLRRLEMGKRVLDQKIAKMTSSEGTANGVIFERQGENSVKVPSWSMVDIMRTTSGLSYFMEFMDRQNRMVLVQFWVVVDGFRNPLEDDFGDERLEATVTWTDTDRLDIAQITETYIMESELKVPKELQNAVQTFLQAGRTASPEQYRAARTAILSSQSAVLEELQKKYLPRFRESDLYYKFLASDEGAAVQRQPTGVINDVPSTKPAPLKMKVSTPPMSRNASQAQLTKSKDLRRAALSSSDVKSLASPKSTDLLGIRRSLDIDRPLFDDYDDNDPLTLSVQSIGSESINGDSQAEHDVIENMEAALTDIMAQSPHVNMYDTESDTLFGNAPAVSQSNRPSLEASRTDSGTSEKIKPSLATLGLVNSSGRIGVFQDNDLFGDEAKFAEDEYADHEDDLKKEKDEEIHQAAPGDLGLTEAISALSDDIERLVSQESVVDTLTRKAELTNNVAELRILGKSKASLQREIRRKELQRQQYIIQESDNSLYGRASISIDSVMVGREEDGQEYAVYIIKIQRRAGDQMPAASWAIAHRYSEFHDLHQKLRRRYPSTRSLEFPRRRMVMKLQKQFLHNRRLALEAYLQQLLHMPDVCRSREFRSFLSQAAITQTNKPGATNAPNAQDMVTRIYNSVTDGMDEFLGNMAMLDQLSVAGQNLISAATNQINATAITTLTNTNKVGDDVVFQPGSIAEAEAELRAFEDKELTPFVKPICDLFLEAFELNRGNNWLRGRAVVVVIHQLLGGTVERKVRDSFSSFFSNEALLRYIQTMKDLMWPTVPTFDPETGEENKEHVGERQMRTPPPPRTKAQKDQSRKEAGLVLSTLIPELAGSVVGRTNAQHAARRIIAVMNNRRLNEHLVYTILDEIVTFLFDEAGSRSTKLRVRKHKDKSRGKGKGKSEGSSKSRGR